MSEATAEAASQSTDSAPSDAIPVWQAALRDVAIVSLALSLFGAADAWHQLVGANLSALVSIVDGLLVGAFATAIVHEWGHFTGARLGGAQAPVRELKSIFPIFDFDFDQNLQSHFLKMSVGGNVGHWLAVVVLFASMPLATPGQAALVAGSLGFAIFASTTEFPVIGRAYKGMPAQQALSTGLMEALPRNGMLGAAVAGVTLLWLA